MSAAIGYGTGNILYKSLIDLIMEMIKAPYLPILRDSNFYNKKAIDICTKPEWCFEQNSTHYRALEMISIFGKDLDKDTIIPVFDN